jgi:Ni/Co efflux regulator RcnB
MKDHDKHHSGRESNPDRGPPMQEGEIKFDKGYVSNDEHFDPGMSYGNHQRGNQYMAMQNKVCRSDNEKLERSKFTKIQ